MDRGDSDFNLSTEIGRLFTERKSEIGQVTSSLTRGTWSLRTLGSNKEEVIDSLTLV